ncbi:ABC transporter ATP-binding protein [Clostridium gasigenes]|uniref:ABC-2 type transport system ATP-binding protein n=1 Tax=Clostridium gasigenes TaxID=94869 RepID=A0A1H0QKL8_9CLOT|nr:ATP-binding cassette domain-containing protein [Clostridium gasigenes]SDP17854.1 ABC-2 type transport system ATP-binding protein [Clostridium gasigenes]
MKKVIEVEGLTKVYNNGRGIKNISFEVYTGEVFGFLGPNGAGKTTVMKSIIGLNAIESGSIKILGFDIKTQFEDALKNVGSIIETAEAYEYMSAYDNLKIASRFYDGIKEIDIDEILNTVKLKEFKREKVSKFSLGMKQRLGLALALLSKPELVILDEPTNGLDIEGTVQMRNMIIKLSKEQGITFFISSHLIHEIELMCNRIAIIHNGELVNNGTDIDKIKKEYNSLEDFYMHSIGKETEDRE